MDDTPGGRLPRFRTAGTSDAPAVAALHTSSWRRHSWPDPSVLLT